MCFCVWSLSSSVGEVLGLVSRLELDRPKVKAKGMPWIGGTCRHWLQAFFCCLKVSRAGFESSHEARKLKYECPPTPKPREGEKPVLGAYNMSIYQFVCTCLYPVYVYLYLHLPLYVYIYIYLSLYLYICMYTWLQSVQGLGVNDMQPLSLQLGAERPCELMKLRIERTTAILE